MMNIEFPFGQAKVRVLSHRKVNQGLIHHIADIRIGGNVQRTYLGNEIIDLVSRSVGFCPLKTKIIGSRVVIERGVNFYELHWQTESGRSEK
jgi:hypothetical protein